MSNYPIYTKKFKLSELREWLNCPFAVSLNIKDFVNSFCDNWNYCYKLGGWTSEKGDGLKENKKDYNHSFINSWNLNSKSSFDFQLR